MPSFSASLHAKAKKYTCDSDFPILPRFFCPDPKHDQTFYCELKENYSQLGRKCGKFVWKFPFLYRLGHAKACRMTYANTKGADQTVHPHSLIIAFVVRCLDCMEYIRVKSKVKFKLAFVADQAGLNTPGRPFPEKHFCVTGHIYNVHVRT